MSIMVGKASHLYHFRSAAKTSIDPRLLTRSAEPFHRRFVQESILAANACMQESVFSISQVLSAPLDQTVYPVGQNLELSVQHA
jgi:hypothetical protein